MQRMGCVPSLQRGEIVVFNLGNPHFGSTSVDKLLGNEVVRSVTKVPAVRNENWERAKPAFKPFLEEAQQIRAEIAKGGIIGFGSRLEPAMGMVRSANATFASKEKRWATMQNTPGGWLERVNTALADYGLEVYIDRRDGDQGFIAFGIVDPKSPEAVAGGCANWPAGNSHCGTGLCC